MDDTKHGTHLRPRGCHKPLLCHVISQMEPSRSRNAWLSPHNKRICPSSHAPSAKKRQIRAQVRGPQRKSVKLELTACKKSLYHSPSHDAIPFAQDTRIATLN